MALRTSSLGLVVITTLAGIAVGRAAPPAAPPQAPAIARNDTVIFELPHPIKDPDNFNWFLPGSLRDAGADQVMWEPLFLLDYGSSETGTDKQLEPWLATGLTKDTPSQNPPKETWTLTLRKDVKWSDGQPFNANDVVFTVGMVLNNDFPAMEAVTLKARVESVARIDDLRVRFTLRNSYPRFKLENFGAALFSSFLIMPAHIWQGKDPAKYDFYPPIGTGPYKFKESAKDHVTWVRDDNWWGAKASPKFKSLPAPLQLFWKVMDATASKTALVGDDLDAAREYTLDNFNDAKGQNAKIVGWDPVGNLAWNDPCPRQLDINTKYVRPGNKSTPWSDPNLRKALSLLIDRTNLANTAYGGTTQPSLTMFANYGAMNPFINALVTEHYDLKPKADPAAAEALLAKAGYQKDNTSGNYIKDSAVLDATILVNADVASDVKAANVLAEQLGQSGIQVKVQAISNDDYWGSAVPTGGYEIVYGWLSCGSVAEPYTSMNRYATDAVPLGSRSPGFNNTGRWDTAAAKDYAAWVQKINKMPLSSVTDLGNLLPLMINAYKDLDSETPFIPLVQSPKIIPFNTRYWTGWPTANDPYGVPMHNWAATHRLIHKLKPAS